MRTTIAAVGALVALACPGSASAKTYCVPAGGAGCTNGSAMTFQQALDAASANPGADAVKLAAGTYQPPSSCTGALFHYNAAAGNTLTISGAGSGQTILTCPAGYDNGLTFARILILNGPATITGVGIHLPAGHYDRGVELDAGATATHIALTSDSAADDGAIGVILSTSTLTDSTVAMPPGDNGTGVVSAFGGTIDRVSVTSGGNAIQVSEYPATTVEHAVLAAPVGVAIDGHGSATVYDSAIDVTSGGSMGPYAGLYMHIFSNMGHPTLAADNVSIGAQRGGAVGFQLDVTAAGTSVDGSLVDSVISGPATALERNGVAGATTNLTTAYDDYPAGNYAGTGGGKTVEHGPALSADPGFVSPATGNFHLVPGSPLIDAGTPDPVLGAPNADLAGNPRILAGNGSCTARRDIGAYEYVAPLPATAVAMPTTALPDQAIAFEATGCSINPYLAPPTFTWAFDDGSSATGADVSHAFATAGTHSATVTDKDAAGHTGTATVSVVVNAPVTTTTMTTTTTATTSSSSSATTTTTTTTTASSVPALGRVQTAPGRFRTRPPRHHRHAAIGTTIGWTDSAPATTTLTISKRAPGIRRGRSCVARGHRRPRHPRRCTRNVIVGTLVHQDVAGANRFAFSGRLGHRALRRGTYTITLIARVGQATSDSASTVFTVIG